MLLNSIYESAFPDRLSPHLRGHRWTHWGLEAAGESNWSGLNYFCCW